MKNILLTGATGFLGSHLLGALLKQGYKVTILKRSTSDTWRIKNLVDNVHAYDVDVTPLEQAFKDRQVHAVIHTACSYGRNNQPDHEVVETNLLFGLRLLDAAIAFNVQTFVNTDTFFNDGKSSQKYLNAYSLSKKQFLEWLCQRKNQIQLVNLRLQHMYGPKDDAGKFVPWLISQFDQGVERVALTKADQLRDFIYVEDVVSAYLLVLRRLDQIESCSEYGVGTGVVTSVRHFVEMLKMAYVACRGGEGAILGFGDLPGREGEIMAVDVDNSALIGLGWSPQVSLYDGIVKTLGRD